MDLFDKHYTSIWKALIRPPRQLYKRNSLGPSDFSIKNHECKRYDIAMTNSRNKSIQCSYYKLKERSEVLPVVIYLHGNSSSRLTAVNYVHELLNDFNVFTVDLSGSGRSEGEYVSLGYHQKQDLKIVIKYLQEEEKVKEIFIWGRSMGAVTAILYTAKYQGISGLILDSPFSDLQLLIKQAAESYITLPDFILNAFINNIRQHIKKLMLQNQGYEFDILKLKPINDIKKISVPIYFFAAKQDKLVASQHTCSLYKECSSRIKKIDLIDGGHNGSRNKDMTNKIISFLKQNSWSMNSKNVKIQNIDVQNQFESLLLSSNKIIKQNQRIIKNNTKKHIKLGSKLHD